MGLSGMHLLGFYTARIACRLWRNAQTGHNMIGAHLGKQRNLARMIAMYKKAPDTVVGGNFTRLTDEETYFFLGL
jgi:hypothetical protein